MLIVKNIFKLHQLIENFRIRNKIISLIPTMGSIHDGHLSLVKQARKKSHIIIVSIFVNPLQFGNNEDFSIYPRNLKKDYILLKNDNVDLVFVPTVSMMYPNGLKYQTFVEIPILCNLLDGIYRPKHFRGVLTIISKLFNIIKPNYAYFGEKDFQQLIIIRKLVVDMNYNINIIGVPTLRTKDGLALSSRNQYLTNSQLKIAVRLNKILTKMATELNNRKLSISVIIQRALKELSYHGFKVEILTIRDAITLKKINKKSSSAVILATVWLDRIRLIDNKLLKIL